MVFIDNTVALRQLELANVALLSRTNTQTYDGKSLAKDGKFHPRVLTLVSMLLVVSLFPLSHIHLFTPQREATIPSPSHFSVGLLEYTDQSGQLQ